MSLQKRSESYARHMDEVFMDQQLFVDPYYDGYDEWLYFQQLEKKQAPPKKEDHVDSKQQREEDV